MQSMKVMLISMTILWAQRHLVQQANRCFDSTLYRLLGENLMNVYVYLKWFFGVCIANYIIAWVSVLALLSSIYRWIWTKYCVLCRYETNWEKYCIQNIHLPWSMSSMLSLSAAASHFDGDSIKSELCSSSLNRHCDCCNLAVWPDTTTVGLSVTALNDIIII